MKASKALALILALVILTGIAAYFHLSTREEVTKGTVQVTMDGRPQTLNLSDLSYEPVSGIRVNGKGESISVEGDGISVKAFLEIQKADSYTKVTIVSDDSYSAELTAEEIGEEGKAYLMLDEAYLRLVVFGDPNSKRSVSNVVQIIVE